MKFFFDRPRDLGVPEPPGGMATAMVPKKSGKMSKGCYRIDVGSTTLDLYSISKIYTSTAASDICSVGMGCGSADPQAFLNLAMALKLQPSMTRTGRLYKDRAAGWNQVEKMVGDVPKRLSASKRNQNMRLGVLNLHNVRERELQGPKVIRHHSTIVSNVSSGTISQTTLVAFCILT